MAIIYTYPQADSLENNDLFVISHMDAEPGSTIRQTRSISAAKLADYIVPLLPPIPVGGPFLPLVAGPTTPLTGDLYMDPDGTGAGSGSHAIVFSGIDDTGAQLVGGEIFTQDSIIAPSGQDLVFNNADDNGVLQTNLFINAFGQVGVTTTTPNANLDIATDLNVGTSIIVGTNVTFSDYGSGSKTGTATYSLAVTAAGQVIEEPLTSGTVTGTGTTDYFVKFIDGPNGVIGDVPNVLEQAGEVIFQQDVRFDDVVLFDGGTVGSFQNIEMLDGAAVKFVDTAGPTTDAQLSSVAGSGKLNIDGSLQFDDYGSGTITGTAAYNLSVDASGNVIETAAGGVTGTGVANTVAIWDSANNLTNGSIPANGFYYFPGSGSIGLGTSTPNFKMDISGGDLRFENNDGIRFGGTGSNNTNWRIWTSGNPGGGSYPGSLLLGRNGNIPFLEMTTGPFSPNNPGQIIFNRYGSGGFTGTAAYNLSVDANGNIIETAAGGGGGVGGGGTIDALPIWTGANTLGDSLVVSTSGGNGIGINMTPGAGSSATLRVVSTGAGSTPDVMQLSSASASCNIMLDHTSGTVFGYYGNSSVAGGTANDMQLRSNNDLLFASGGSTQHMNLKSTGDLKLPLYGSGTYTGTATFGLSVDASGNVIETALGPTAGYKSVQVFQWPNGSPVAYANWPNAGGSLLPFNATPLVETGTYSGTAANFAWTCVNTVDPSQAAGQYAQFTLGANGAGTWRISTCQHWFDQLNNVNINVVFNLNSGGVNTPTGVINEKSADGATTNKIFYGEIVREFVATDKIEVRVTFSNGGIPGPFPSANDNRPISITFERLV